MKGQPFDNNFKDEEFLLRGVFPPKMYSYFWEEDKIRLSSAAFKHKGGLSVDRSGNRTLAESVEYAKTHLSWFIVSVTVYNCNVVNAALIYKPSAGNIYHSEIHGSNERVILDEFQAKSLARAAIIQVQPT